MRQRIRFCISADGTRLAWAEHGHGRRLVKVAHWVTHVERDWENPVFRPRLTDLGTRYRLLRYDGRDTGLSDRAVERMSLEAWVEDLAAVVDAAGLERFPLLGLSQGGPVAIAYATRHPQRVSHLVLAGTFACGRARRMAAHLDETDALATLLERSWDEENAAVRQMWTTRLIPGGSWTQMQALSEFQRRAASPEAAARSYRVATHIDVTDLARRVAVPTLVLHARGDAFVPFEAGRELAGLVPGATFVPLDSDDHLLLASEPAWRRFLTEVESFLRRVEPVEVGVARHEPLVGQAPLTLREQEVLDLLAAGESNRDIAVRLHISPKTVRNHVSHVFEKLGVDSRAQAIVRARQSGFGSRDS